MRLSGIVYDASVGKSSAVALISPALEPVSLEKRGVVRRAPYRAIFSLLRRRVIRRAGLLPSTLGKKVVALLPSTFLAKLGMILIVISLLGLFSIFGPILKQERPEVHSYFGDLLKKNPLGFSLLIPKINLRAKIIPNVDPNDQEAYEKALEQGIGHSQGSVLPGMKGNIYLFSHSSLANPLFYQLGRLEKGDEVVVYFEGQAHHYQIQERKILSRRDTSFFAQQNEKEQLILQTCWPPGTDLQQLLLMAVPAT